MYKKYTYCVRDILALYPIFARWKILINGNISFIDYEKENENKYENENKNENKNVNEKRKWVVTFVFILVFI